MSGIEYLEHLHEKFEIPWPQLVLLLIDPDENNWTCAARYGIRPIHVQTVRRLCCEMRRSPTSQVTVFLQSKIQFDTRAA